MPWTFAHPAAVLPLRRLCPRWFNFPGLVIGSLTPDFGYYLRWLDLSRLAHRFPEGLPVCLLSGALLLTLFYALRRSVCGLLPQPHRNAWLTVINMPRASHSMAIVSMVLSLAIGAATHMAWDGFTHRSEWAVARILALQTPVVWLWGNAIPAYQLLQHVSTLAGVASLVWVYVRWLRTLQTVNSTAPRRGLLTIAREDRWRYRVFAYCALISVWCACVLALEAAMRVAGAFSLDVFVFRLVVDATVVFTLLMAACALMCARVARARLIDVP